ncbi:hypothetical protein [Jatrophihabitans endophyticus]|uniref:hypothetical protein n=1 Tax=Jatrophihabitans endophyticus TaxID=1206085 RepID=UPI0019D85142|nr:hypothetical protein [Jatrophihabitans endophyticus]MBE7190642.1 hypothetical protein [Jatrophihabitans endophyticus]
MEPISRSENAAAVDGLDAVRMRRAELRESLSFLEFTLAAPASGREVVWGEAVHDALVTLVGDFGAHVDVTECAGGLHETILSRDLRLTNAVDALTAEHAEMSAMLAALVDDSRPPVVGADVDTLRERATCLLGLIVRHRQTGADLVYEAFHTDVGGAD